MDVPTNELYVPNARIGNAQIFYVNKTLTMSIAQEMKVTSKSTIESIRGLMKTAMTRSGLMEEAPSSVLYATEAVGFESSSAANLCYFLTWQKAVFSNKDHALFLSTWKKPGSTDTEVAFRSALHALTIDFLRAFDPYLTVSCL